MTRIKTDKTPRIPVHSESDVERGCIPFLMNETKLGTYPIDINHRDAVHVAVFVATSKQTLEAGDMVALSVMGNNEVYRTNDKSKAIGIVDPFMVKVRNDWMDRYLDAGQLFYVLLFPGTVTGMVHRWNHPAFDKLPPLPPPEPASIEKHEAMLWLNQFAMDNHFIFDEMIDRATAEGEPWITSWGHDLHSASELEGDLETFFQMIKAYTGKEPNRKVSWSCSC